MVKTFHLLPFLFLCASLTACENVLDSEPVISADVESDIYEYERPVVYVSRTSALGSYIPCQVVIDGIPVTALNAAGTTLINMASQDIKLPRISPGRHEIELRYGKSRKLYRDAEAACGEMVSTSILSVDVKSSESHVLVLAASSTDVDRYVLMPDSGIAIIGNTGERVPIDEMKVLPDIYTVTAYPNPGNKEKFVISQVGDRISVTETETAIGNGIDIIMRGMLEPGNENSRFRISASGYDYTIQVMN